MIPALIWHRCEDRAPPMPLSATAFLQFHEKVVCSSLADFALGWRVIFGTVRAQERSTWWQAARVRRQRGCRDPPRASLAAAALFLARRPRDQTKQLTIAKAGECLTSLRRQELPGLFVADLLQQLLPVVDVLFVLLRGKSVLRPPAFKRLLFRCAAIVKLLQDLLAVRT